MPTIPSVPPASPYVTSRHSAGRVPQPDAASSIAAALKDVFNCSVTDPVAQPLALVVGAGGGALVAALAGIFNPAASVLEGTALGLGLAALSTRWQAWSENADHAHRARWAYLTQHAEMQQAMHDLGLDHDNRPAVSAMHAIVKSRVEGAMAALRGVCQAHRLPVSDQMERALAAFYMQHCAETGMMLVAGLNGEGLYLVAVEEALGAEIERQLVQQRLPGVVLRNSGQPFMRLDEVNRALAGSVDFDIQRPDQEWRVQPHPRPARDSAFEIGNQVRLQRRRPVVTPQPVPHPSQGRLRHQEGMHQTVVRQGATLREQLSRLPATGVTQRDLSKITEDLANGRVNGHPVKVQGYAYTASDIKIEGDSGRGRWRLLHRRDGEGHELVGIADYHGARTRWWDG